jgi:hypothetical protein
MQYEVEQETLVRKRRILTSFLVRGFNDDDFVTDYAIVNELRRQTSNLIHCTLGV